MNKLFYMVPLALLVTAALAACSTTEEMNDKPIDADCTPIPDILQAPDPVPEPCPITEDEVYMLAQTMHEESQVVYWNGTNFGVSYIARQAAVGWCALNRLDDGGFGDSLAEVLSKPHQFAWKADAPATEHFLWLAQDVVDRWWSEKQGATDVGRTLPSAYLFFEGDGRENHFRKEYEKTGEAWDWSNPDPYEEGLS